MIIYTITGENLSLSDAVRKHIEKRFGGLERFMSRKAPHEITVTASRETAHEREDAYRVEARTRIQNQDFFAVAKEADIFTAVDRAKEDLMREVVSYKGKRQTLFHKGARRIKMMVRSFAPKR